MTISTLFFIFLGVMVFGLLATFINMALTAKSFFKDGGSGFGGKILLHLFFGLFYVVGGLGSLICGVIWIVQTLKC